MAVYAIGDVQGCFDDLQRLLEIIQFEPSQDQVWLVGDLVNRGPKSTEVLRFAKNAGESVKIVLGNHDLHLLAAAYGVTKHKHDKDTMMSVLAAPDRDELIDWLRHQPLFYHDEKLDFSMVHAGLPPQWKIKKALKLSHEVETLLQGGSVKSTLKAMYGNQPNRWSKSLKGMDRARFIINCFTRLRYCDALGTLNFKHKGSLGSQPEGIMPWFEVKGRKSKKDNIVFGHWSTLATKRYGNTYALDSGAVWGEQLTALRIDGADVAWHAVECKK